MLLTVEGLRVVIGRHAAVDGVSFEIASGDRLGLIGESGSGKTLTALALMGLLPDGMRVEGRVLYGGNNLLELDEERLCAIRGDRISMVFQEPMTALNPVMRVGDQIAEVLRIHRSMDKEAAGAEAIELLNRVQISDAGSRSRSYPHQLSGGQRQRVMIAMALACGPDLLIADEPTTALDVTVQAGILRLLNRLVEEEGVSLLLITHDLPVVATICKQALVMHAGRIVERGPTSALFHQPQHPYTRGLINAMPDYVRSRGTAR